MYPCNDITVQTIIEVLPPSPTLEFSSNGNFTILQIADLHWSTAWSNCRDTINTTACPKDADADMSSLHWLNEAIDQVKPHLVVLTGDQLNGQKTSWDSMSTLLKVSLLFQNRTVPWTLM